MRASTGGRAEEADLLGIVPAPGSGNLRAAGADNKGRVIAVYGAQP